MGLTESQRETFLMHFEENGQKATAAHVAGGTLQQFNNLIKGDLEFAAAFEEAYQRYRDSLEAEMHRRGVKGVPRIKVHQGVIVKDPNDKTKPLVEMQYSDSILLTMAKRHIPEYNDKVTGDTEQAAKVMVVPGGLSEEQWAEKYDGLAAAQQKVKDDADTDTKDG